MASRRPRSPSSPRRNDENRVSAVRARIHVVAAILLAAACRSEKSPLASQGARGPVPGVSAAPPPAESPMTQAELPTTDGALALGNLDAEIAGLERDVAKDPSLDRAGALVEGLASRGQFLGRLADYERAAALADAAVARSGNDARAYAMRAKARAIFHRFGDARADLDPRAALRAPAPLAQRPAILQAEGRYDEALTIRHRLSEQKADLSSLASEASVLADMGETD